MIPTVNKDPVVGELREKRDQAAGSVNDKSSCLRAVVFLVLFAAIIHVPLHFGSLYGEQDAARLVNDALIWQKAGVRIASVSEYRFYTSPGYIWLAKQILRLSELTKIHPAFYLNTINTAAAILIVIPTFFLFRALVNQRAAFVATLLLSVMPAFWQAGLYGFPHLPALLFMVCALLLYDRYLRSGDNRVASLSLICLLFTLTVLLKADIYLSAVAVVGLLLYRRRFCWRNVLIAGVLGAVPVVVSAAVSKGLMAGSPPVSQYMAQWNTQYKLDLARLFSRDHLTTAFHSLGFFCVPAFLVALLVMTVKKRYSLALLLLIWVLVPLSFWFFRPEDSARHHMQVSLPIALGIGTLLDAINISSYARYGCVILLMLANYFHDLASSSTLRTSGNLVGSSRLIKARVGSYHRAARMYAEVDAPKKVILGGGWNPYVDNEVLYRAEIVTGVQRWSPFGYDAIDIQYTNHGKEQLSTSVRVRPEEVASAASKYHQDGYLVYSMEYQNLQGERSDPDEPVKLKRMIPPSANGSAGESIPVADDIKFLQLDLGPHYTLEQKLRHANA